MQKRQKEAALRFQYAVTVSLLLSCCGGLMQRSTARTACLARLWCIISAVAKSKRWSAPNVG